MAQMVIQISIYFASKRITFIIPSINPRYIQQRYFYTVVKIMILFIYNTFIFGTYISINLFVMRWNWDLTQEKFEEIKWLGFINVVNAEGK